jgi:hypothetical protein
MSNHPEDFDESGTLITRRDMFAARAMAALLASDVTWSEPGAHQPVCTVKGVAVLAYRFADAMEKARRKESENK